MQPFTHLSIVFRLYTALQYRSCKSSNLLVFHTSVSISSKQFTQELDVVLTIYIYIYIYRCVSNLSHVFNTKEKA